MIGRTQPLPITRQAETVGISRGSVYCECECECECESEPIGDADLKLMRRIDELHLELPFASARMLCDLLRAEGCTVGRKPMTNTIWPYLLRTLAIARSNHVWAMDITYIPMARGFVYLAAVIDWHSRRVLAWRLSISMDTALCTEAVEEASARYGKPEIFNTDQGSRFTSQGSQGSQFSSSAFTGLLLDHGIRISMDGKGCWRDNVFIERVWRSIEYEEVYLHAYETVSAAREGIDRDIDFYNTRRPHSSHQARTPDVVYFAALHQPSAEAA